MVQRLDECDDRGQIGRIPLLLRHGVNWIEDEVAQCRRPSRVFCRDGLKGRGGDVDIFIGIEDRRPRLLVCSDLMTGRASINCKFASSADGRSRLQPGCHCERDEGQNQKPHRLPLRTLGQFRRRRRSRFEVDQGGTSSEMFALTERSVPGRGRHQKRGGPADHQKTVDALQRRQ